MIAVGILIGIDDDDLWIVDELMKNLLERNKETSKYWRLNMKDDYDNIIIIIMINRGYSCFHRCSSNSSWLGF